MRTLQFVLAALLLAGSSARATEIDILLDNDTLAGTPGQTLTFTGVVSNLNVNTVDLNSISVTLNGMFGIDTLPFFFGDPFVAGGGQTSNFGLFSVTIDTPFTDPPGLYMGTATILGGVEVANVYDPSVQDILGTVTFYVDVRPVTSAVPEPSTWVLMVGGGSALLLRRMRRSSRRPTNS